MNGGLDAAEALLRDAADVLYLGEVAARHSAECYRKHHKMKAGASAVTGALSDARHLESVRRAIGRYFDAGFSLSGDAEVTPDV